MVDIKISHEFTTFGFLPFTIAGVESKCILKIRNVGSTKLSKTNFSWTIECEKINIGDTGKNFKNVDKIDEVELDPGAETKRSFYFKPPIPGHHLLSIDIPGKNVVVATEPEKERVTFHADPETIFEGPWSTFFEVYSWYLLAIGLGTLSAFVLVIIEILKAIF